MAWAQRICAGAGVTGKNRLTRSIGLLEPLSPRASLRAGQNSRRFSASPVSPYLAFCKLTAVPADSPCPLTRVFHLLSHPLPHLTIHAFIRITVVHLTYPHLFYCYSISLGKHSIFHVAYLVSSCPMLPVVSTVCRVLFLIRGVLYAEKPNDLCAAFADGRACLAWTFGALAWVLILILRVILFSVCW